MFVLLGDLSLCHILNTMTKSERNEKLMGKKENMQASGEKCKIREATK